MKNNFILVWIIINCLLNPNLSETQEVLDIKNINVQGTIDRICNPRETKSTNSEYDQTCISTVSFLLNIDMKSQVINVSFFLFILNFLVLE
jgi:hypothetical protein